MATLTNEQRTVIYHLLQGHNVFLTGGGGVGKSYLLHYLAEEFPGMWNNVKGKLARVQVCALTGCAALLLGHKTKTLHSWSGIGLGKGTVAEIMTKIRRNSRAMKNWLQVDLLIMDEVSMLTAEILDKLNDIAKRIRKNTKPFGGIQVLMVGDFYQLPPVGKKEEEVRFAFESETWKELAMKVVELTVIQRQKDEVFQRILHEARRGQLSKESCQLIASHQGRDWKQNKIRPTLLFPRRADVEMVNDANLRALKESPQRKRVSYKAHVAYDGKIPKGFTEKDEVFQQILARFDAESPYTLELELLQDAQVMLIANIEPEIGLVNGSRGVIVDFCPATHLPIVEFMNGVRKPIGTHAWPVQDYEFVSRTQIPLRLAYALTIHKSQGASLDSALIDIGSRNFEFGQAYVALSRVRSLDSLYIHDFDPVAFRAHPSVKAFYDTIQTEDVPVEIMEDFFRSLDVTKEEEKRPVYEPASRPIQAVHVVKEQEAKEAKEDLKEPDADENLQEPGTNWLYDTVPEGWKEVVEPCKKTLQSLSDRLQGTTFLPPKGQIWTALEKTSLDNIKVVILGQDPYPTPGNAHGLAFSALPDVRPIPASLKNIYKELATDLPDWVAPTHPYLGAWADQGVFLLNPVLTVEPGKANSHEKIGWEEITDQILRSVAGQTRNVVFVLWGAAAQKKEKMLQLFLSTNGHHVIRSPHPSPLSAHKGFFGSRPFSAINRFLVEKGKQPVDWSL